MAWYDEAVFYHIYPLGLTGAPKQNAYTDDSEKDFPGRYLFIRSVVIKKTHISSLVMISAG